MTTRGCLIAIEGIDGSGKTTLARALASRLKAAGMTHTLTHEPGATKAGARIREIILDPESQLESLTELLLYAADRAEHVNTVIRPALAEGHVVITDRYTSSTLAYQHHARGIPLHTVEQLNQLATGGLQPDLNVLLNVPWEFAEAQLARRGGNPDRLEREAPNFFARASEGFTRQARNNPNWITLDGQTETAKAVDVILATAFSRPPRRQLETA